MPHLQNVLLLNQKLGILILCFNGYNKFLQCKFVLLKVALDTMNQAKPFCCNWDLNFNTSRDIYVMHFSALNFAL